MDALSVADVAAVIAHLRAKGNSEWTIPGVVKAASAVRG